MIRLLALSALIPALMTSTALAADVLAEPVVVDEVPIFTLSATAGVVGFWMPDFESGAFGVTSDDALFGGMLGLSGSRTMGNYNEWDVMIGFNVFGAIAGGDNVTTTQTFSGDGTIAVSGLSAPGGSSNIAISLGDNDANVTLTPPPGGAPSIVNIDGDGDDIATAATYVNGSTGFMVGAAGVTDTTETAFGVIADETGAIFLGSGDLDGLEVTTDVDRSLFYGGADLTIGLGNSDYAGMAVTAYVGPSYRALFQDMTTDISFNLPETAGGNEAIVLPGFTISTDESLNSHYFGGILGGTASFGIAENWILSVGVEGGVYGVHTDWNGRDTYSTGGGFFDDPFDPGVDLILQPDDSVTASELNVDDIDNDTIAFAARGNAAVTWAFKENQALSLGGSLEYLSQVATVTHGDRVLVDDGSTWSSGDASPSGAPDVSWDSMFNFALTASLTGTF